MSNRIARMDSERRTESNGLKIGQIRHPELPQWAQEILAVDLQINDQNFLGPLWELRMLDLADLESVGLCSSF